MYCNQLYAVPFLARNDQGVVAKQIEEFKQFVIHDYLTVGSCILYCD